MKQLLPRATGREIVRTGCAHLLGMRHGRGLDALSVFSITLLMYAGSLKSAALLAWMPVDLTAVALGLVGLSVLMTVVECRKLSLPPVGGFVILASLIPGFLVGPDNPYTPKAQLGICISIYTALAAFVLLGSRERRKMWLGSLAVLGLVVIPLLRPGPLGTLSVGGSGSTISAAQMLGVSVVILLVLVMTGRVRGRSPHLVVAAMILGVLLYALLGTGSRGPTLAAAVALMVTVVLLRPDLLKRAAAAVALVVVMGAVLGALGFAGIERMRVAASGSFGDSPRVVLWEQAVQAIPGTPTGFGWGRFRSVLSPEARLDSGFVQYPHNTVLEASSSGAGSLGCRSPPCWCWPSAATTGWRESTRSRARCSRSPSSTCSARWSRAPSRMTEPCTQFWRRHSPIPLAEPSRSPARHLRPPVPAPTLRRLVQ